WIDCKPGSEVDIARMLAGQTTPDAAAKASGVSVDKLSKLLEEFQAAASPLLLASGSTANGADLTNLVARTNVARGVVGGEGKPVRTDKAFIGFEGIAPASEVRAVADLMNAGQVSML